VSRPAVVRVDLGARGYDVVVGRGVVGDRLGGLLSGRRRCAVVTQERAGTPHAALVEDALVAAGIEHVVVEMGDGEEHKTLGTVEALAERLAGWGLKRSDAVVALGGGIVGDTAGFLAATYMRGVPIVQVPTTLLAMVDSAIGGKTGVNLGAGKNLVGAFHQPIGVLADPTVLATLPDREYRCGLGEVAKYALLGDLALQAVVADRTPALLARDPGVLAEVVAACAAAKAAVVAADEEERTGARAVLNYGHTLAHALETAGGYRLAHGEAVAVGLVFAGRLAAELARIPSTVADRHRALVEALGLPVAAPAGLDADEVVALMRRDKKSEGGLTFVLAGPSGVERVDDPPAGALLAALGAVGVGGGEVV